MGSGINDHVNHLHPLDMPLKRITEPAALAVSLADAKSNLRIDSNDMDAIVNAWIMGITDHAEHYMGRAILTQTWQLVLDAFPTLIRLSMPPVASVTSVKYIDTDGNEQTLAPSQYIVDTVTEPCRIIPAYGVTWPSTREQANAVRVEFVSGYGATEAATPSAIRLYLLAKLVEQFDPQARPDKDTIQSTFIERLLDRYRVLEFG